eukprot:CAMPEP_0172504086 /NCGR_PEP_ID=MMETSP1066-20121228/175212_1 /TAXON_ID=671091 /ORGANISM="Coscinodiscus wailesii, Strain CCMP2513" /LENGTH=366 /DNA_ID=CAMNT_0013280091 /DNA_START=70 /DNA_END=1171 /DNA_ORIENTATION=+
MSRDESRNDNDDDGTASIDDATRLQTIRHMYRNRPLKSAVWLTRTTILIVLYSYMLLFGMSWRDGWRQQDSSSGSGGGGTKIEDPRGLKSVMRINNQGLMMLKERNERQAKEWREHQEALKQQQQQRAAAAAEKKNNSGNLRKEKKDGKTETQNPANQSDAKRSALFYRTNSTTARRARGPAGGKTTTEQQQQQQTQPTARSSYAVLLTLFFMLTLCRAFSAVALHFLLATDDDVPDGGIGTGRGGRRSDRRGTARARYRAFVESLNRTRRANGEMPISEESLRLVISQRDFNPNDYDDLLRFNEENGPAVSALVSSLGATRREIERCPSHVVGEGDDLLKMRSVEGRRVKQRCAICLEEIVLEKL